MKTALSATIAALVSCLGIFQLGSIQSQQTARPRWTWPGDRSPAALAEHLENFHSERTTGLHFSELVEKHDAIHDQIGPVQFDAQGNAYGETIGFIPAGTTPQAGSQKSTLKNPSMLSVAHYGSTGKSVRSVSRVPAISYRIRSRIENRLADWRARRTWRNRRFGFVN